MTYSTTEQLRILVGVPEWTDDQEAKANLLLDLAAGVIEEETGQSLEQSTDTLLLDATGGEKLVLPRWPVTAVTRVALTEDDTELVHGTDYTWSASGVLTRKGTCWPCGDQAVEAIVTAGFAVVPRGVSRIELRLASAVWNNPLLVTSESLGDLSRTWSAEQIGMELSERDRRTLAAYRSRTSK